MLYGRLPTTRSGVFNWVKSNLEDILIDQSATLGRLCDKPREQPRDQIAIELNERQIATGRIKPFSDGAVTGSDLNHGISR
jgi:hypothetical protein